MINNTEEKADKVLCEIFNTAPLKNDLVVVENKEIFNVTDTEDQIEHDHNAARNNVYSLIEQGSSALNYALSLAKQSDNPEAFNAVSSLLRNLSIINDKLLDLHRKKNDVKRAATSTPEKTVNNTNNTIFVGTPSELSKLINGSKGEIAS